MDALFDTAIVVDIYRNYPPAVQWSAANPSLVIGITSIVWLEVLKGAKNKADQKPLAKFLAQFPLVYLTQTDEHWAMLNYPAAHLAHGVGILDTLIAAPSHRLQIPLYTRNLKHMSPLLGTLAQAPYT